MKCHAKDYYSTGVCYLAQEIHVVERLRPLSLQLHAFPQNEDVSYN